MVHQYQLNGYNIVLDTCSGSIHVVDEVAYDIIALFEDHAPEEIVSAMLEKYRGRPDVTEEDLRACLEDVQALKDAGKLFSPDTFAGMAGTFKERSGDVVKALCLHVAHTCNLNCGYCFASQGKYHGERALMSFEVGKQALDFLMDHSGSRRNLEVDFFGGEPLMNWDVVKGLVEYARSVEKARGKNFRFTLTTNGMLLDDEVIDFANREMSNVVLSLDGRKEIHDRTRVDYAGNGSYDRIVPKFQKLVAARGGKNYYMRGTFTHQNPDFTKDLFHMADDLGFTELSMEPVVCAPDDPAALTPEDIEMVKEQYEILAKDMLRREKEGRPITFYHYMPGPHRGALRLQAHLRLRLRHRVHGRYPLGGPVPLPPVCGGGGLQAGGRVEGRDQHCPAGGVPLLQRLRPPRLQGLLGEALLLRRVRRQRLPRHRLHPGGV